MARKFDPIKDINDSREIWTLAVRIIDVWFVKPKPPHSGHYEMILMDAKGDQIQVSMRKDEMLKWETKLKEHGTYVMHNFHVVSNDLQYKAYDHPYRLNFIGGTTLKERSLPDIPPFEYRFKSFGDILSGNFRTDLLLDVVGALHEIVFRQPNGNYKVVFNMKDVSGVLLNCTLWDDHAMKLLTYYDQRPDSRPMIIILTHARIKEAHGIYLPSVSNSWSGSKLLINEDIVEVQSFKNSFGGISLPEPSSQLLSQMTPTSQYSEEDRFMYNAQVKSLSGINALTQETICVTVATTGKFNVGKGGWNYEGCIKCNKRTDVLDKSFTCKCGKYNEKSVPRYKLDIKVVNKKDSSNFIFWNCECEDLIGSSALTLRKKMLEEGEDDPNVYPEPLDKMLATTLAFRVKVQPSYNNASVIKVSDKPELIQAILKQLESEEDVSTMDKGKAIVNEGVKGNSDINEDFHYDVQSLSATTDHDPDLPVRFTPAKRLSSEMLFDDTVSQDLASAQLSSTKMQKNIKTE